MIWNRSLSVAVAVLLTLVAGSATRAAGADPVDREIKVTARRFAFEPSRITVQKGERVKLIVTSEDVDHGFAIEEFGIDERIKAKQTKVIELTPDHAGRFKFSCSVRCGDGHADMVGYLVVSDSESAPLTNMSVTFDESTPGVVYVQAGGERVRIDTNAKVFARVADAPAAGQSAPAQKPAVVAKRETGKASEPYDYHIVNVPTPKQVRRHSLNAYFTHRFSESIIPLRTSDKDILGLDSFSISSFGLMYGITDRLYVNAYRSPLCQPGVCKTIELGLGFHVLSEAGKSPVALSTYASIEGDNNFERNYTFNLQAMLGRSVGKYANLFFSPAIHINANGQNRFNPKPEDFFPPEPLAQTLRLGSNTGSFGFGANIRVRPTASLLFEYTPRIGFKLGQVIPVFVNGPAGPQIVGFKNQSEAEIGFGIEKRIGRHVFSLTFSNTQATTTSRYNSSNLALPPDKFIVGFNLYRRLF